MPEGNKLDLNIGFNPTTPPNSNYKLPTGSKGYFGNTSFGESQYDIPNTSWANMTPERIEKLRGERQGWGAELANAIGGGLAKIPFTVIGNTASMLDFEDYFNIDNEVGNAITAWSEEVKGDIEKATKIYKSNDNELSSREWWMNNAKGLFDSAGAFALTGAGLGKGVQLLSNLAKGSRVIQGIGTVTNATMLNQAESIPIAMSVYKDAYQINADKLRFTNPDLSDEEIDNKAKEIAADAAAYSIAINRINIPLNLTSAGAFLRPIPLTRQVAKDYSRKEVLSNLIKEGSQEYLEENINMIAENEAKLKARQGNEYTYDFNRTVSDMLSKDGFEQGLVGFIGGAVQTGATDLIKSFQKDSPSYDIDGNVKLDLNGQPILVTPQQSQKERFKAQQKSLNTIELLSKSQGVNTVKETLDNVKTTATLLNDIQEAALNGDDTTVQNLQNKLLVNQSLNAFKNGTTDQLIDVYKSIQKDPTSKEKYGEEYMTKSNEAIKTIEELEKVYIKHQSLPQVTEVFNNRSDFNYTIKEADALRQTILNTQSDQLKEIEVTGFTKPEQIETLASTKELNTLNTRMLNLRNKAVTLNDEYQTLVSPEYTSKKIEDKQVEPEVKEQQIDNAFGVTEETKKVDIPDTKGITIESIADKMINRKPEDRFTPEESQFYENNKNEIEQYIQALSSQQDLSDFEDTETIDEDNQPPSTQDLSDLLPAETNETEPVVTKEIPTAKAATFDLDVVAENLLNNTPDKTSTAEDQVLNNPIERQSGLFSDIEKGISRMANVVMMKIFNNYFEEGVFRFERNNNGTPEVNEQSQVDVETLNTLREGDTVEFELVELTGKALEDYNKSKEESIKHINHNITNMGNVFGYTTNDKNYGFDDKHIAIKSNGKIIGYVQQPHAISNTVTDENKQSFIDARNEVLAQRKAIIDGLTKGKVTTKVKIKGTGNLYTKLTPEGKVDLVNDLFTSPRDKDKTPNGNLIFVFNDGKGLRLPKTDDPKIEDSINQQLAEINEKTMWGQPGSVYQLVKDTNDRWYPIPVYSNLINAESIKGIISAIKGLSNASKATDVVNALNPYIYSTFSVDKKAPILIDDRGHTTLTIDGIKHSIDDLKRGVGLAEFKKALSTKRQNIEILNINSTFTQEDIAKRNTLASNAVTYKGEYLVQPFVSYEPITQSKEVKEYKQATVKNEDILNKQTEETTETPLEKAIREKESRGEKEDFGFSRNKVGTTLIDKNNFEAWLDKNLPGLTISNVDSLGSLKANITDALGAYRNMVIYLFEGATNRTGYHEAFHGVFRNMLSNEQKFGLLEQAINKYEPPTQSDLDFIQEGLSQKATVEQLTYLYYEEKLADDFAEFVNNNEVLGPKSTWDKIKAFFNKILDHFNIFTNNKQYAIDELFDAIRVGKFAKKSTVAKKNNLQLINKELSGNTFGNIAFERHSAFTASFKWDRTKSIGDTFMIKYNQLVGQGITNISASKLFDEIYNQYLYVAKDSKLLDKMTLTEVKNLQKVIDNFEFLKQEATKYLENYNISFDEKTNNVKDTPQELTKDETQPEGDEEVTTLASQTTKGLGDWVSQAGLKSASVRIKMFVSSIPITDDNGIELKDAYGFPKYHEFSQVYYLLERSLTGLNTFGEMIDEMTDLSELRPELKTVIDRLTKESTYTNKDELVKLQNDFKSNFTKQQLNYSLVKFDTNSSNGEVTYRIFDANRQSVKNMIAEEWKNNLVNPNRKTIAEHSETEIKTNGTNASRFALEQWVGLAKNIIEGKAKRDVVTKFLGKLGIEFSPETLSKLLSKKASSELIPTVTDILKYYNQSEPDTQTSQSFKEAFDRLVNLQANSVVLSYTQSFNNVENSNIYTIQLPSFASKMMDDLTSRDINKFKSRLNDLQKDPLYTYSNLLQELRKDNDFRTTKFRLNYLDGLKDEKGNSDGSKFTNMSPKDFMSMQIALFQNRFASSAGQISKSKTNKYIYITPSDKSMCMIFDGKSYNSTLNEQGDIDINTPIVNNFYNVLLQEASRIKQQLEIKSKVESGELDKDGKDLLVHYHYAPNKIVDGKTIKGTPLDFNGFAYQIMHFGIELDEKGNHKPGSFNHKFLDSILELLQTSDDVQESLLPIEEALKKEITEILKKEFHNTLNEAVTKGVIREVKKGEYENIALDVKNDKSIKQQIADFSLNTWLNNIEMSNLLNGDVALYKANDLQKRTYQSQAMGVNINISEKPTAKTLVVKDFEIGSNLEHLKGLVSDDVLDSYKKNNVTDAQVLVSPSFYKSIFVGRGTWTNAMQTAFDIAEGIIANPTTEQLTEARLQLSNIKPFYFGNRFDDKLGIQRYEQVKCAMLPLFKSYIKDNPLLAEKRSQMDNDSLDMIAFESSFKATIGYKQSIDTNSSDIILDLDMKNFMVQVDNPAHIIDEENDSIRQLKMLFLGNINPNTTYSGVKGSDLISLIDEIEGTNIEEDLNHLNKLINGKKSEEFKTYLKEMLTKRNATENMMEALNIVDGDFEYALDGGPTSIAMQNLISSLFTNKVIKQKFEGGSGVQASSIGMRYKGGNPNLDKMQSDLNYMIDDNGKIWSEAIMPAWSKEFFNEDGTHKDNIPDNLKELLFYRIPTEGFHSMMAIKVKGFLPVEYGNTILMPYEVTTQFGADFDFDKVYFLSPEFKKDKDGNLVKVEYDNTKSVKDNSRSARNNKVLDNYLQVLTSKEILPLLLNPSGFEYLAKIKSDIDKKDNIQPTKGSFFSSRTQRDYKSRNHVGMGLKGQLALHVTGHSYSTLLDLSMKTTKFFDGISFNGVKTSSLSSLYSLDGTKLISKEVSSMMAAILDDIKNPIIQALGINEFTADTWATIVRAGFDAKTAVNLITQPSIVELSEKLAENNYKIKSKGSKRNSVDTLLDDYNQRYNSIYDLLTEEQQKELNDLETNDVNLNDKDLESFRHFKATYPKMHPDAYKLKDMDYNFELARYYQFQVKVLSVYGQYDKIAKDLVKINRLFGVNKEVGPNMEDIINKKYLMNEIEDNGFSIQGLNVHTLEKISSLKKSYDTHLSALEYLSKYFPYDSSTYKKVKYNYIDKVIKNAGAEESLSKINVEKRMLINGFIRNFIDSSYNNFIKLNDVNTKEQIYKQVPALIDEIKKSENDEKYFNGALRKNVFIEALQVKFDDKNKGLGYITIKANRLDVQHKNNISEAIYSLYSNHQTKHIIEDLINYSFVATGFHRGLKAFYDLIPPVVLKEMGYADYRKSKTMALKLDTFTMSNIETERLVDQMIRNFPNEFTKTYDMSTFRKSGKNIQTDVQLATQSGRLKELVLNWDRLNEGELPIFSKYVRMYDDASKKSLLYKHTSNGRYEPISKLGKPGNSIEVNALEDIKDSIFSENNLDNKSILTTFADETNTNEESNKSVLDTEEYVSEQSLDEWWDSKNVQPMIDLRDENIKPDNDDLDNESWTNVSNDCGI